MASNSSHEDIRLRSEAHLQKARDAAQKKRSYNSEDTWKSLHNLFYAHFGSKPYDWQLDVTEALLLGLDSVVIASTGSGKTMPFMLPLLLHPKKLFLILFIGLGIRAKFTGIYDVFPAVHGVAVVAA